MMMMMIEKCRITIAYQRRILNKCNAMSDIPAL